MSEAKHTPGPWEVRQDFYIGRPGKFSLAEVKCGDVPADDIETHKANARLIAAAPDLLDACKEALHVLTPAHPVPMDGLDRQRMWLRDAIAKATRGPITEEPTDVPDPL